uniref:Ig-like domain-containing protein n=1 Tax=Salmo trutta TaxID=8032 RepID=A0A673XGU4_SALTR
LLSVFKEKSLSVFHSVAVKAVTTSSTSKQTMFPASLLCAISGYSLTDNSYAVAWIRQPSGKAMECIFYIWGGGTFYLNNALKNKFSFRRDMSSSTSIITGQNLQIEDTAVYYCARRPQ